LQSNLTIFVPDPEGRHYTVDGDTNVIIIIIIIIIINKRKRI